jgi:hypothetical protein
MSDVRWVSPDIEIRQALEKKGGRYGALGAPFLIVVADCKDELSGGESIAEALLDAALGTVVASVTTFPSGERDAKLKRRLDGYFGYPAAPKNRNVSAVVLLPRPHLWDLRNERWQPLLLRNPWSEHPHPEAVLPLPSYRLTKQYEFEELGGTMLADILGLPEAWPPKG